MDISRSSAARMLTAAERVDWIFSSPTLTGRCTRRTAAEAFPAEAEPDDAKKENKGEARESSQARPCPLEMRFQ